MRGVFFGICLLKSNPNTFGEASGAAVTSLMLARSVASVHRLNNAVGAWVIMVVDRIADLVAMTWIDGLKPQGRVGL